MLTGLLQLRDHRIHGADRDLHQRRLRRALLPLADRAQPLLLRPQLRGVAARLLDALRRESCRDGRWSIQGGIDHPDRPRGDWVATKVGDALVSSASRRALREHRRCFLRDAATTRRHSLVELASERACLVGLSEHRIRHGVRDAFALRDDVECGGDAILLRDALTEAGAVRDFRDANLMTRCWLQ